VGTPSPYAQRLMVALTDGLTRNTWATRLPNVAIGQPFWATPRDAVWLVADGFAEYAPDGTVAPPPEPPHTANGTPGVGAGTSNSSP